MNLSWLRFVAVVMMGSLPALVGTDAGNVQEWFGFTDSPELSGALSALASIVEDSLDSADVEGWLVCPCPDGRFAFSHSTVEQAERQNFDVGNHVVDLTTRRAIFAVDARNGGDFGNRNHGGLNVKWRFDRRAAIFHAEGKWDPAACCVLAIGPDDSVRQVPVDQLLNGLWSDALRERWPQIHGKLTLEEHQKFDGEFAAWVEVQTRIGCEFVEGENRIRVHGEYVMNPRNFEERLTTTVEVGGAIDLKTGLYERPGARVPDAAVVTMDAEGNEIFEPRVEFGH